MILICAGPWDGLVLTNLSYPTGMDSTTFPWLCMAASHQCSSGQKALCVVMSFFLPQLTATLEDWRGKHFSVPSSNCLNLKSEWQAEKKKDIFIILKVCKVLLAHHTPHSSIKMILSLAWMSQCTVCIVFYRSQGSLEPLLCIRRGRGAPFWGCVSRVPEPVPSSR